MLTSEYGALAREVQAELRDKDPTTIALLYMLRQDSATQFTYTVLHRCHLSVAVDLGVFNLGQSASPITYRYYAEIA